MSKARRMKEKEKKRIPGRHFNSKKSNFIKCLSITLIMLITLSIIIFIGYYFLFKLNNMEKITSIFNESSNITEQNTLNTPIIQLEDKKIENIKSIKGLEPVKILSMNIEYKNNISFIKLSFRNDSDKKIKKHECTILLLNKSNKLLNKFLFTLPEIDVNSTINYSIACSDTLENVTDYSIEAFSKNNTKKNK